MGANSRANTNGLAIEIAKNWKPSMYLTNVSIAYFQQPDLYVAPSIFPICPVPTSTGQYYIFNKAELAKDQVQSKPAFGKVQPAVFSHDEATYSTKVDQVIVGVDDIAALNYQRSNAPASIDPKRAKAKLVAEQLKLHLDNVFGEAFFQKGIWKNEKVGSETGSGEGQFEFFNNTSADIVGLFDEYKRQILLDGRRVPNKLCLGYDAFVAIKNHPQFLERVVNGGSTPNPATVNEEVIAKVLGLEQVKVLYSTKNAAELGQDADMQFIFNSKDALLCYTTDTPSIDEPSAGYIFAWDMLGNGNWMATDTFEGEGGTHSEYVEGLMASDMRKTCDDLAIYLNGCVK